jgi:hypothetical protein
MRHLLFVLLLWSAAAAAQLPRNEEGLFELSQTIHVNRAAPDQLSKRARSFFDQPFLVHWDTVYQVPGAAHLIMKGEGYVDIRAKLRSIGSTRKVPVWFEFTLQVNENAYRYTINHFVVWKSVPDNSFPFEQRPESVRETVYDQLLQKTQKRISFITGWLKRYMDGGE